MKKSMIAGFSAVALLAAVGIAAADTAVQRRTPDPAVVATVVCRPALAGETSNATFNGAGLLCKKVDVATTAMVTGKGGPDLSKARTMEDVNAMWWNWASQTLEVRSGDGGGR
jgi:hypothetical protein